MSAYLILDEGGFVLADGLPPIVRSAPVAIVSVAEKVRQLAWQLMQGPVIPTCINGLVLRP